MTALSEVTLVQELCKTRFSGKEIPLESLATGLSRPTHQDKLFSTSH